MTVNTTTSLAVAAARDRSCPLCETPPGQPCQDKPSGDHLARYLDAYRGGQITRGYVALVLGELIVIDDCAVIAAAPQPCAMTAWCPATTEIDDETLYCEREAGHPGSHRAPGPDEGSEVAWSDEKPPGFDCDCGRLPWPGRMQDETCPGCGAVWEHDGVSIGGGARLVKLGELPAAAIVAESIRTGTPVIVEDDRATPEERLLLSIFGVDPDDAHNVRELRKHAVTCTKDDHSYCLAYLPGIPEDHETAQASALVGRLVEDAHDDSPCPAVGLVVGQVDEDTLEVLWGDRRFEENPGTGTYEPFDALRPARDGAR
jgi:hypothetical protein